MPVVRLARLLALPCGCLMCRPRGARRRHRTCVAERAGHRMSLSGMSLRGMSLRGMARRDAWPPGTTADGADDARHASAACRCCGLSVSGPVRNRARGRRSLCCRRARAPPASASAGVDVRRRRRKPRGDGTARIAAHECGGATGRARFLGRRCRQGAGNTEVSTTSTGSSNVARVSQV